MLAVNVDRWLDDISNFSPIDAPPHLDLVSSAKRGRPSIEHILDMDGVAGSIPAPPTSKIIELVGNRALWQKP
jgi:hypothetical protein